MRNGATNPTRQSAVFMDVFPGGSKFVRSCEKQRSRSVSELPGPRRLVVAGLTSDLARGAMTGGDRGIFSIPPGFHALHANEFRAVGAAIANRWPARPLGMVGRQLRNATSGQSFGLAGGMLDLLGDRFRPTFVQRLLDTRLTAALDDLTCGMMMRLATDVASFTEEVASIERRLEISRARPDYLGFGLWPWKLHGRMGALRGRRWAGRRLGHLGAMLRRAVGRVSGWG